MQLIELATGATSVMTGFADGISRPLRERLEDLGFTTGATITCALAPALGAPRVYSIRGSTFSLEDAVGQLILVEA